MKKVLYLPLLCVVLSITACGGSSTNDKNETSLAETTATTISTTEQSVPEKETSSSNNLEVEKGVFDVTINIPAEYVGETTQDELDKKEKEEGYKAVLNDDGSVTYTMTKKQHKEMMKELEESFNKTLSEMVASEDYPNITDIKTNSNYTEFIITTKSNELDLAESLSTLAFYMYGGMYNMFNGTPVDNVHIEFINADSGDIIDSMDSKDSAK